MLKLHVLGTVLGTQLASLFLDSEKLPYFPIEVSRSAANGHYSRIIFQYGIALLPLTAILSGEFHMDLVPLYVSLLLIAFFNDVDHYHLHSSGVFCLFLSFSLIFWNSTSSFQRNGLLLSSAVLLMFLRWLAKICVVYFVEFRNNAKELHLSPLPERIWGKVMEIMYRGRYVCRNPRITLTVFRCCAVGQWIVFLILSQIVEV